MSYRDSIYTTQKSHVDKDDVPWLFSDLVVITASVIGIVVSIWVAI